MTGVNFVSRDEHGPWDPAIFDMLTRDRWVEKCVADPHLLRAAFDKRTWRSDPSVPEFVFLAPEMLGGVLITAMHRQARTDGKLIGRPTTSVSGENFQKSVNNRFIICTRYNTEVGDFG